MVTTSVGGEAEVGRPSILRRCYISLGSDFGELSRAVTKDIIFIWAPQRGQIMIFPGKSEHIFEKKMLKGSRGKYGKKIQ